MFKSYFVVYLIVGICSLGNFFFPKANASTLFAPDTDTALLFNLVTTTASQLNELEKLVTNAEKYTGLMEKYNQIAKDEYFRAERIQAIAQNFVEVSTRDPKDLAELNSAIRALKSETDSFKTLIAEYNRDEARNAIGEQKFTEKANGLNSELRFANNQVLRAGDISTSSEAQKVIAQNSALSYKSQVEGNQINSVIAERLSEQNKLLNREMKTEVQRDLDRDEYYQIQSRTLKRSNQ